MHPCTQSYSAGPSCKHTDVSNITPVRFLCKSCLHSQYNFTVQTFYLSSGENDSVHICSLLCVNVHMEDDYGICEFWLWLQALFLVFFFLSQKSEKHLFLTLQKQPAEFSDKNKNPNTFFICALILFNTIKPLPIKFKYICISFPSSI